MDNELLSGTSLLIVEDEPLLRKRLLRSLEGMGADVTGVENLESARRMARGLDFDFALIDVNLPDGSGLDLLREKVFSNNTGIVVMTANAEVGGAVEAIKLGALDYLVKPFEPAELPLVFRRARQARQNTRIEEHRRRKQAPDTFYFGHKLSPLKEQIEKILAADERMQDALPPVLIEGETGTGKTTIARWLTEHGPRGGRPLVEVNCSALPESLAESELFGHEKGAFTDARTQRMGLFEAANGGTLFLDELPSLSASLQAKVLTAIEDRKIRRLGGNKEISVDTRIIAATNRELRELVAEGAFREDLLHRLDLYRIKIPPLRERGEDIVHLAGQLVAGLCKKHRLPVKEITAAGTNRLLSHPWPGNVRELSHELERAIVFEDSDALEFPHLSSETPADSTEGEQWFNSSFRFPEDGFFLEDAINHLIHHALEQTGDNVSAAARLLGVSRDYIRYRQSAKGLEK